MLEYQLIYIPVGEGQFESAAGGKQQITPGTVFLTFPNDWHRYRPTPQIGWQEYWIGFNGVVADRLVKKSVIATGQPILRTTQNGDIQRVFDSLLAAVRDESPGMQQILAAGIWDILGRALAAERIGPKGDRHSAAIKEVKQMLANSYEKPLRISQLAARCHLSEAQFRRVFHQHVGVTPNQFYIQVRINRAKELLSDTTMSIKQIAAKLQFEDQFHFSKSFRKVAGLSPSEWRGRTAHHGPNSPS